MPPIKSIILCEVILDLHMTIARGEERLLEVDRSVSLFRMEAFQVRASTTVTVVFAIVITVQCALAITVTYSRAQKLS